MSIEFSGTDEHITCGSGASIDDIFASGGSVATWLYLDGAGEGNLGRITDKSGTDGYLIALAAGIDITLTAYKPATNGSWIWNTNLSTGTWYHFVITYNSSATANDPILYIDGTDRVADITEDSTPSSAPTITDSGDTLYIGDDPTSVRAYDGKMEDMRMYKRVLSAEEVAALYAGYRGVLGGEAMWINMNEAIGAAGAWEGTSLANNTNYLPDLSANSNVCNPVSTPTGRASKAPRYGVAV